MSRTKPEAAAGETAARPTQAMTAVVQDRYGGPDVVRAERVPRPVPGPQDVLVRVVAAPLTAADVAFRSATPWFARLAAGLFRPRSRVLGSDAAGEVTAVGAEVGGIAVGDRVHITTTVSLGAHAEYVCQPAAHVVRVPDGVDLEAAVVVAEAGLTALPFLRDHATVGPGTRILVNGAAGSVGSSAVQLAVHLGAHVTATCSTDHVDLVASLGAHEVVDRTRVDFTRARDAYDVVFDAVGRSSFRRCRRALRPRGVYLTTVPSFAILVQAPLTALLRRRRAVVAFTGLRSVALRSADAATLLDLARDGVLRPVVDSRFTFAEAAAAHARVDTGHKAGAVVLRP